MIPLRIKYKGQVQLIVTDRGGFVREDTGWQDNLILNSGLDMFRMTGPPDTFTDYCKVGTGDTEVAPTQTLLNEQIAEQSITNISSGYHNRGVGEPPEYIGFFESAYMFPYGAVSGTVREVGVGPNNISGSNPTGGPLFNRIVLDTPISVSSSDQLTVNFRLLNIPGFDDVEFTATIEGVDYEALLRPAFLGKFNRTSRSSGIALFTFLSPTGCRFLGLTSIGPSTEGPWGADPNTGPSNSSTPSIAYAPYTIGNYYNDFTLSADNGSANFSSGIQVVYINSSAGAWQIQFSPAIPKDHTKDLHLTFRMSWGRA